MASEAITMTEALKKMGDFEENQVFTMTITMDKQLKDENEKLKEELEQLKSENEQLKSVKQSEINEAVISDEATAKLIMDIAGLIKVINEKDAEITGLINEKDEEIKKLKEDIAEGVQLLEQSVYKIKSEETFKVRGFYITEIEWDDVDEDCPHHEAPTLPSSVLLGIDEIDEDDFPDDFMVSDWLSDNYGWCVIELACQKLYSKE